MVGYVFPGFLIEFWTASYALDTLLCLWVLIELARVVFRFNRRDLPSLAVFVPLLALTSAMIWPFTRWSFTLSRQFVWQLAFRVMQTGAILEVSAVLTLILWCGSKNLHWPERELRIVTGIGCWAFVQLCAVILHSDGLTGPRYHWVDLLTPLSALCVFIYWLSYFWLEPGSQRAQTRAHDSEHGRRAASRQDQNQLQGACPTVRARP